jgi:hypothetical protein
VTEKLRPGTRQHFGNAVDLSSKREALDLE